MECQSANKIHTDIWKYIPTYTLCIWYIIIRFILWLFHQFLLICICWVVTILTCTYISICMKCKSNKNVYKTTLSIGRWFWYSLGYRCNCSFLSQYFIVSYLNAMKMKLELHAKKVWLIMWVASLEWMDQRLFTWVKPKHRRTVRFHCNPH